MRSCQPSQLAATQKFTVAELKVLSKELKHLKKLKRPSQAERVKLAKTYESQLLLLNRRWNSIEKKLHEKAQFNQAFLKDNDLETPRFKGAFIDGAIYPEGNLDMLAKLKSRDELLADILGLLLAPITNVASALGAQGSGLASIIQQISEKEEA